MSVTVSNGFQICNSPLNLSKSKAMYSFPRDQRFRSTQSLSSAHMFYELPSTKMTRASAIGYGNKYDFTKSAGKSPAPNTYDQKIMTIEAGEKKGWSFGLSRENMTKTSGPLGQLNTFSPGPGTYKVPDGLNHMSYSLRQKTQSPDAKYTNLKSPGPGTYAPLPAITEDGKYFISKYKNSGALHFNPASSVRFPVNNKNPVPGPGTYQPPVAISSDGRYFVSRYKSSNSRAFPHSTRKFQMAGMPSSPGPGAYRLPSEFGYYESKTVAK